MSFPVDESPLAVAVEEDRRVGEPRFGRDVLAGSGRGLEILDDGPGEDRDPVFDRGLPEPSVRFAAERLGVP